MQNVVVVSLALLQVVGLFALITALQKARDGKEDSGGFHMVTESSRHHERQEVETRS